MCYRRISTGAYNHLFTASKSKPINAVCLLVALLHFFFFLPSCNSHSDALLKDEVKNANPNSLFRRLTSDSTGIRFANNVIYDDALNVYTFRNFYNGGGVGIGDINNDVIARCFLVRQSEIQ